MLRLAIAAACCAQGALSFHAAVPLRRPWRLGPAGASGDDVADPDASTAARRSAKAAVVALAAAGGDDFAAFDAACAALEATQQPAGWDGGAALDGAWEVVRTNAPPPSNGRLGPISGVATQVLDTRRMSYLNVLDAELGGAVDLKVTLSAQWAELSPTKWKVSFIDIAFEFGGAVLLRKQFPDGSTRIWHTSYVDADTRIVRAGVGDGLVGGKKADGPDDDVLFYMTRPTNAGGAGLGPLDAIIDRARSRYGSGGGGADAPFVDPWRLLTQDVNVVGLLPSGTQTVKPIYAVLVAFSLLEGDYVFAAAWPLLYAFLPPPRGVSGELLSAVGAVGLSFAATGLGLQ